MRHEYQMKYPDVANKIKFLLVTCAIFSHVRMPCPVWTTFSCGSLETGSKLRILSDGSR